MSRSALAVGLVISAVFHVWLLGWPSMQPILPEPDNPRQSVTVVELDRPTDIEPAADPAPEPMEADDEPPTTEPAPEEPAREPDEEPPAEQEPPAEPEPEEAEVEQEPATTEAEAPELDEAEPDVADSADDEGDLTGAREGNPRPDLRIDWGSAEQARAVLNAGEMKLVVLETQSSGAAIRQEVEHVGGRWRLVRFQSPPGARYSSRLRIVDRVPAFAEVVGAIPLRPSERLAVLMPREVFRQVESARLAAASERGLAQADVLRFGGSFGIDERGDLTFDIGQVVPRRPP